MSVRVSPVSLRLRVRPADLDGLGHVNNAVVLQYLEAGRWAWMDQHGVGRDHAVLPVVSRIEIDYLREIPYGDLQVTTAMRDPVVEGSDVVETDDLAYKARFSQEVSLADGVLAARASVAIAFIDGQTRGLCTLQDFLRGGIG